MKKNLEKLVVFFRRYFVFAVGLLLFIYITRNYIAYEPRLAFILLSILFLFADFIWRAFILGNKNNKVSYDDCEALKHILITLSFMIMVLFIILINYLI